MGLRTVGAGLGTVGAGLGTIVGAGLGTVGAGLGTIVGAGLGTKFSYLPITEQQNPPSSPTTELIHKSQNWFFRIIPTQIRDSGRDRE